MFRKQFKTDFQVVLIADAISKSRMTPFMLISKGAARHPATLLNQVTFPGETSAEALYHLEKAGFRTAISRAVLTAYQRSLELGKEKPGHIDTDEEK